MENEILEGLQIKVALLAAQVDVFTAVAMQVFDKVLSKEDALLMRKNYTEGFEQVANELLSELNVTPSLILKVRQELHFQKMVSVPKP